MREIRVDDGNGGQRLDKLLLRYMNKAPKSFIYKMLRKKNIKLNGKRAEGNEILKVGDVVTLYLAEETIESFFQPQKELKAGKMPPVIYEDDNVIIVNKPVGLLSQGERQGDTNLNDIILAYLQEKGEYRPGEMGSFKGGIVSRLDRNTSGITLMGKNLQAQQQLSLAFKCHSVVKTYIALAEGAVTGKEEIRLTQTKGQNNIVAVDAHGKEAITTVEPIKRIGENTLIRVNIKTGRTHQIRLALSQKGHPLAGDVKYGGKPQKGLKGQALHAYSLKFNLKEGVLKYLDGKEFTAQLPNWAT